MNFINKEILEYVEQYSSPESELLYDLNRQTNLKMLNPQMLSGHIQGLMLKMFSMMIKPECILEIGTFTGYSAICLAAGLKENGKLYTIELEAEREALAKEYFERAGFMKNIKMLIGDAIKIIPAIDEIFDLVFIDADKPNYSNYYDLVFDKLNKGGFIIADNVLWSGRVLDEEKDRDTAALAAFNEKIRNDSRVENLMLPIRDGLMIIRKL